MHPIARGLLAGFAGTFVLSALMIAKSSLGLLPQFDVIVMLTDLFGAGRAIGWIIHFAVGTLLWGGLYGLFVASRSAEGHPVVNALALGGIAWFAMMVLLMPVVGGGFFAVQIGLPVAIATLVLHLIYATVMGFTWKALPSGGASPDLGLA